MVERRVTFDRAVWTKPLASAADAVSSAMCVQSCGPPVWERATPVHISVTTMTTWPACEMAIRGHRRGCARQISGVRAYERARPRRLADQGHCYDVSWRMSASQASSKTCRAVSRSTTRMGAPQRGQGHAARGGAPIGGSIGAGAALRA